MHETQELSTSSLFLKILRYYLAEGRLKCLSERKQERKTFFDKTTKNEILVKCITSFKVSETNNVDAFL